MSYIGRSGLVAKLPFANDITKVTVSYLIVLVLWQIVSTGTGQNLFPGPIETFSAIISILDTWGKAQHIFITLYRTIVGTILTGLFSLVLVIAATYISPVRYFFLKVIYPASRALPAISFALLAIVWFGLGTNSVIFVVFITVLPIYLVDLWEELKVTEQPLIEMARSLTDEESRVFRKVILPMLVPRLFSSTKLNFSVAFKLALVGELLAAQSGMGFRLYSALNTYRTDLIFAWTLLVIIIIMLAEYYLFDVVEERYLTRWVSHD